jgi:DNA polymerase elongation subunit (family B)
MIVNIEQRSGKLIISYVTKKGEISYMQLNVPLSHQFTYVNARYANQALPDVKSWDNKGVKKIASGFLTRHRIQEFFIDAGEEIVAPLFERNMPQLYSCDIEVDVTDEGFASPEDAKERINAISWSHYPEIISFGLKSLSGEQCDIIEKKINKHIKKLNKKYTFIYKQYDNEATMLHDFLFNYAKHAPLITGWNFWNYDWRYIYNRCRRLNLDISWMSPTNQWYNHRIKDRGRRVEIMLPQHKLIIDYLEIYKKWDRTIDPKENNTLDFVAEAALGIRKVKYAGTFQDMYNKDYDQHILYNAIDSILVEEIHNKLKTMGTFLGLGNITQVEAMGAFSPIKMLEATLTRYAYYRNQVFPKEHQKRERGNYEGAFVFEPTPNLYSWLVSFDYASLYPSIMRQFKISIENFVTKDINFQLNHNQIKCISGAVFDKSIEPFLPEILTNYYNQRRNAKKISQNAEKKYFEFEKILKKRKKSVKKLLN